MITNIVTPCPTPPPLLYTKATLQTPSPGYTPIRQNGSIAPVYILFWTKDQPFYKGHNVNVAFGSWDIKIYTRDILQNDAANVFTLTYWGV